MLHTLPVVRSLPPAPAPCSPQQYPVDVPAPAEGFEDYFPFISPDLMAAGMLANNPNMVSE